MSNHAHRRVLDRREQGFTLIELLVVVIIIGILAAIAIPAFLNQRKKSVDAGLKAEIRTLALAQESWMVNNRMAAGTTDVPALQAAGYVHTPGNEVWIYVDTVKGGYALMARNPGDSMGGIINYSVVYDSLSGGFRSGGKVISWTSQVTPEGAIPPNGNDWTKIY